MNDPWCERQSGGEKDAKAYSTVPTLPEVTDQVARVAAGRDRGAVSLV